MIENLLLVKSVAKASLKKEALEIMEEFTLAKSHFPVKFVVKALLKVAI